MEGRAWKKDGWGEKLKDMANKKCNHCYGRGYVAKDTKDGKYIACRCIRK